MKVSTYQGMHPSARPVRHSSSNVDHCNSYRPRCEADLTTLTGLALCAGLLYRDMVRVYTDHIPIPRQNR